MRPAEIAKRMPTDKSFIEFQGDKRNQITVRQNAYVRYRKFIDLDIACNMQDM